ncbi:MAG TPA: zinc ribbon domain-containing protein [Gemmatimonadaceae bacterium]|nr:zinc ribbon domain-containing protein [Gemmatimonadaceae bacterium]
MATYEYRCRSCHATFSVRERMSEYDAAHAVCPQCKSRDVERVLSEFYARTPRKS